MSSHPYPPPENGLNGWIVESKGGKARRALHSLQPTIQRFNQSTGHPPPDLYPFAQAVGRFALLHLGQHSVLTLPKDRRMRCHRIPTRHLPPGAATRHP